jgi:hypothetical protein
MFSYPLMPVALAGVFAISGSAQSASSSTPPQSPSTQSSGSAAPEPQTLDQSTADVQSAPQLTIRQTVRRVVVDVMVRDAHGKPVHGLTANDFSIIEDKEQQRILSFDAYDFDKPSISRGPNAPPLPPNMFVNVPQAPEHGPLYVILYDLVNTATEDQMTARGQILKFIRSKPDGTRFALFTTTDKLRMVQGFTEDKELLYSALDPKNPHPRVPKVFLLGVNYGRGDPYTALDMLTHLGQYLDGIPGARSAGPARADEGGSERAGSGTSRSLSRRRSRRGGESGRRLDGGSSERRGIEPGSRIGRRCKFEFSEQSHEQSNPDWDAASRPWRFVEPELRH